MVRCVSCDGMKYVSTGVCVCVVRRDSLTYCVRGEKERGCKYSGVACVMRRGVVIDMCVSVENGREHEILNGAVCVVR